MLHHCASILPLLCAYDYPAFIIPLVMCRVVTWHVIRSNALVSYWLETQICLSLISPRYENESNKS